MKKYICSVLWIVSIFFSGFAFVPQVQAQWAEDGNYVGQDCSEVPDFSERRKCRRQNRRADRDQRAAEIAENTPVFNGPGLEAGSQMAREDLTDSVSKQSSLKRLAIGWTRFLMGLTVLLAVLALIYAGFNYVTSLGDDARIETSKKIILWVVVGLILMIAAYAIVNTLINFDFGR